MAKETNNVELDEESQRRKLKDEKKQLKKDQKEQKKEAKKRADEIARQEDELDNDTGGGFVTFLATVFIVLLWLAVICVVIKLDVGGFGSNIMTPIFKNVPVINKILPNAGGGDTQGDGEEESPYGGYASLEEAVAQIRLLESQLETAQLSLNARNEEVQNLKAEVNRLSEFEKRQVDFERISKEFYEKVVNAENGPGIEEYKKWYEQMDKTTADYLYKQVITQLEETKELQNYVNTYANMKPKQAAAAFEKMTDNLNLVARILKAMDVESRAKIMDALNSDLAARLTKIMEP